MSVLTSALVAVAVARRQARDQLKGVLLTRDGAYLGKLYDARLDCYPTLYAYLGGLGSKIMSKEAKTSDIRSTWESIRDWDKKHAIFFSPFTVQNVIRLRKMLVPLAEATSEEISRHDQSALLEAMIDVQMCLKTELGVLDAVAYHNPTERRTLKDSIRRASSARSEG